MQVKRLALAAGVETAFEFESYASNSIVIKNETADEILFCDGPFNEAEAAHIPAFSWQSLNVRVFPGESPLFYVKAGAAGYVEIDFGSSGMGAMGNMLDVAGMIPHKLTLIAGEETTLTVMLTKLHGQTLDLEEPIPILSDATVFNGDVISITPAASEGYYAKIKINGVDLGRLESGMTITIDGETVIEAEAIALVAKTVTLTVGADTTLTAAQTRLVGMLADLVSSAEVVTGGAVYVGDTVEFTAATTAGEGYHVTLTIDDELVELTENGEVSVTVADNIVAVSASVADEGGE